MMNSMSHRNLSVAAILPVLCLLMATSALAHHLPPGIDEVDEFAEGVSFLVGFTHPLSGLDHLLAALLTGAVAARLGASGRRALITGAAGALMAGFWAGGVSGILLPGGEAVILASIAAAAGTLILRTGRALLGGAWVLVIFQLWHGNAHGLEIPAGAAGGPFALGVCVATWGLFVAGAVMARRVGRWWSAHFTGVSTA